MKYRDLGNTIQFTIPLNNCRCGVDLQAFMAEIGERGRVMRDPATYLSNVTDM